VDLLPLLASLLAAQDASAPRPTSGPDATAASQPAEAELRARFRLADRNRNDWISLREASDAFGLDRNAFARFDADGDGRATFEEFARRSTAIVRAGGPLPGPPGALGPSPSPEPPSDPLPPWLRPLDPSGSGRILIQAIVAKVGTTSSARASLVLADRDHDGSLDFEEIAALGLVRAGPASRPTSTAPASGR